MNYPNEVVPNESEEWERLFLNLRNRENVSENFRRLRNLCSQSEENRMRSEVIVTYCLSEGVDLIRNDYVAWQFIANATSTLCNCRVFRKYLSAVEEILEIADERMVNAIYMCIHNCYRSFDDFELNYKLVSGVISNIHLEFPLIVAEDIVKSNLPGTSLVTKTRFSEFVQVINNHPPVHENISSQFLEQVKDLYKKIIDDILKSEVDLENIQLTQTLTEFFALVSPHHHSQLQIDNAFVTSVTYFLKMLENSESECCQPKRSIEDLKKMGQHDGIVNVKCDLVKIITSLCHKNFANQNLVHECGLVPVILNNMRYDARNPFIREACIHCCQVLCENNENIQQYIAKFSVVK